MPESISIMHPFNSEGIKMVNNEDIEEIYSYISQGKKVYGENNSNNYVDAIEVKYIQNDELNIIEIKKDGSARKISNNIIEYMIFDSEAYDKIYEYYLNH